MYTPDTLFDDRYVLKRQLGRGSFGEVWLATDQQVGVDFAIKIYVAMDPKGLDEFRKEYKLSCNLINSNLLHVNHMGVCHEDSCPYLVMPFCPRGSSSYVGNMDEHTLWKFLHDVANGLAYLHSQNPPIVHQDIKPDNILQTQSGDFVITDFGISKQMRATLHSTGNDNSGAIAYMGPERFGRQYNTIKSSDIWSLGATLYELASGNLPFQGMGGGMLNAGAEIPDIPSHYSAELNNVVRACMSKNPWDRPSAAQLVEMADNIIKGHPVSLSAPELQAQSQDQPERQSTIMTQVSVQPQTPVQSQPSAQEAPTEEGRIPESSKSRIPIYTICAFVALAIVGFIGFMLYGSDDEPEPAATHKNPPAAQRQTEPVSAPAAPRNESETKEVQPAPSQTPNQTTSAKEAHQTQSSTASKTATSSGQPSTGTVSVGYGTWTGGLKNGKPHGQGTMTFSKDYDLQGHAIKSGDTVRGECQNGKLTGYCKWHSANGEKSILLGE